MKTNILVIFTGGTIGATTHNGVISVEASKTYQLFEMYNASNMAYNVKFTVVEVFNILSENSRPRHWSVMANTVLTTDLSPYDGVIITYGTDTLAYAAAALAFTLASVSKPVVLVSSDKPLEERGSNGLSNFSNAVSFIVDHGLPGVYAIYRNPDSQSYLHLGARLTSALPFVHSFRSAKDAYLAQFIEGKCEFDRKPFAVCPADLKTSSLSLMIDASFSEDVLYIRPYPGLNYEYIDLTAHPKAVLHDLYHSGTACTQTDDDRFNVLRFVERCAGHGIPFYVAPIPGEGDIYETCRDLVNMGVIALHDMAVEAALVKVMLAYGNVHKILDVTSFVRNIEVAHEFIRKKEPNNTIHSDGQGRAI